MSEITGNKNKGKYARNKGHRYERLIVQELRKWWPDAVTSRANNKNADDEGIDIDQVGLINVQCKNTANFNNPIPILKAMRKDDNINVVFNKTKHGEAISMTKEDFYKLLDLLKADKLTTIVKWQSLLRKMLTEIE